LLVETADISILTDPAISYAYNAGISRYMYSDLPPTIDYVLITHQHQDHCLFESLLQLRHKIKNVIVPRNGSGTLADPSLKKMLEAMGFRNVKEIDELESIEVEGGSIVGLPFFGEHADLNIRSKVAYLIQLKNRSLFCGADSNAVEPKLYERLREMIGSVDIMFIGMECDGAPLSWLYGPLLTSALTRKMDQSRRFDASDYEKAREIVGNLNPQHVYVYAMGQEPWLTYLTSIQYTESSRPIVESNRLVEDCRKRGLISERLFGQKELFIKAGQVHLNT
jgi:L-ascorbate metabolism protein UlaG (beta-lactamase superfamily)